MPRITWSDEFSVSNQEIDEQHKKWLEIINELHDTLMQGKPEDLSQITGKTFKAMEDYVKIHFSSEEEIMRKIKYPGLPEHKVIHEKFMARIVRYRKDFESGNMVLNSDIMKILTNWLQDHILNEDKKIGLFAAKSGK